MHGMTLTIYEDDKQGEQLAIVFNVTAFDKLMSNLSPSIITLLLLRLVFSMKGSAMNIEYRNNNMVNVAYIYINTLLDNIK